MVPKDTATKNGFENDVLFRNPFKVCVWFSANRKLRCMPACMQQTHHLLPQQAQFSDGSVYFLMGILQYIEGQTKNLTKCHEKLVARVKTMVEEDGRIYIF